MSSTKDKKNKYSKIDDEIKRWPVQMPYKDEISKSPKRVIFGFAENKSKDEIINVVKKSIEKYKENEDAEKIWEEFKESVYKYERESKDNKVKINSKELHELFDIFLVEIENFDLIMQETLSNSPLMRVLAQTYVEYEEKNSKK